MAKDALDVIPAGTVCGFCDEPVVTPETPEAPVVVVLGTNAWLVTEPDPFADGEQAGDIAVSVDFKDDRVYHSECWDQMVGILLREDLVLGVTPRKAIMDAGFTFEQIMEYVDEAENQEGFTYWNMFKSTAEVILDLKMYYTEPPEGGPYKIE